MVGSLDAMIAGAENSGVEAALDDLFQNRRLILTPAEQADPDFLCVAQNFWQAIGSDVSLMSVEQHDAVLAATSHLPHILAFSLVDLLGKKDETVDIFKYAEPHNKRIEVPELPKYRGSLGAVKPSSPTP
jgi:prephenate dehydrogenase